MHTRKGEAARAGTRTASTPKCHPGTTAKKPKGVLHHTAQQRVSSVLGSRARLTGPLGAALFIGGICACVVVSGIAADATPASVIVSTLVAILLGGMTWLAVL